MIAKIIDGNIISVEIEKYVKQDRSSRPRQQSDQKFCINHKE